MRRTPVLSLASLAALALVATGCSSEGPSTATGSIAGPGASSGTAGAPGNVVDDGEDDDDDTPAGTAVASGNIVDPSGKSLGSVQFQQVAQGMEVTVTAAGLTPGFHGIHVHAVGKCEPNSPDPKDPAKVGNFNSSGGHLHRATADHPEHDGDLPNLLAKKDGSAAMTVVTDRMTAGGLRDADGAAFMIHAAPDNHANIPTRYAKAGADAETKKAGDSGPRVGCAVLTKS